MREGHTNQSSTISPLQVKANSLFRNILPPSPFASGFWPYPPHISSPQPIENRDFGWNDAKKDEIYPALGSMLNPDAFEGSTHASPRDFARCKLIEVISFPSSSKGILPMATLEAPVRPRTTSHRVHLSPSPFLIFATKITRAACAPPSAKCAASWATSMTSSSAASTSRPPTRSSR